MALPRLVPNVPALKQWPKLFKATVSSKSAIRLNLVNVATADRAMAELNLKAPNKMTAVELYPGVGVWTSALVNGGIRKVMALEPHNKFSPYISDLAKRSEGAVEAMDLDGYDWSTYLKLKEDNILGSKEDQDWSEVHKEILFTGTIPKSIKGEQLLAQLFGCIINKMALHSLGRIQMAMWIPTSLYTKIAAPPGDAARCKLSIVRDACADISVINTPDPENFYPPNDYQLLNIVPLAQKRIQTDWDVFEYVLRHIFVTKKQKLSKAIK
ncbi:ribosomal RNA adenine methyltransferase KsgA/Erm [Umbelopsis sp. PMI_123]|nr:ribosomal RNA adenine methyltransferase KsgA/Erm [Umbelopsis sp. PMI_123]